MSNQTDSTGTTASSPPSDGAWVNIDMHTPVPDTSMLPGSEKAPAPAVQLMTQMVKGAHETIDRLAASAAPTVQQWSDGVAGAEGALHAKTEQWRATGEQWTESLRGTVRSHPLVAVVAALALGALVARISSGNRGMRSA